MARKPDEYAIHFFIEGGHHEEVRFSSMQDFQKWYSNELTPKQNSGDLINIPMNTIQGEYMVVRPNKIAAIRVEPIFLSSIERN